MSSCSVCTLASVVLVIYLIIFSSFISLMNQEKWLFVTLVIGRPLRLDCAPMLAMCKIAQSTEHWAHK